MVRAAKRKLLAICGGGNAGHALAVVTSHTFEGDVVWLVGSEEKAKLLRDVAVRGGLASRGALVARADKLQHVSADPAEVIPHADVVVLAVPAFAHTAVLAQIEPYLGDGVLLGCAPSRSGFEFDVTRLVPGIAPEGGRTVFGVQTLPWSARVVEPGRLVNFAAVKANVPMAALPGGAALELAPYLSRLFGTTVSATSGFLNLTLGNPGQFIHPGLMYGHFRSWRGGTLAEDEVPKLYADADDRVSASVEALSVDILGVAAALAAEAPELDVSGVVSAHEWLQLSYPTQIGDLATVSTCFRTGPFQSHTPVVEVADGRFAPDFHHRYLTEDVPYGLVVTKAMAELVGVSTPVIDRVVRWAERSMGRRYLVDGAVGGPQTGELPLPQNHGIDTLDALVGWYMLRSGDERLESVSR